MTAKEEQAWTFRANGARALPSGPLGFLLGVRALFVGLSKLRADPALRRLSMIPLLLTFVLYALTIVATPFAAQFILEALWSRPERGAGLYLWYALGALLILGAFAGLALLFTTVVELVGGTFYDRIAVKILTTHGLATQEPGFVVGTIPDLVRGLAFLGLSWAFALLSWIWPPLFVVGLILNWLAFAMSSINAALLVTRHSLFQRIGYVLRSFGTMLGLGAVVQLSLFIPFLGVLSIPAAVVGASDLFARHQRETEP